MKPKRKSRARTPKSKQPDINEFLIQAARTGIILADKGLEFVENLAHRRELFKTYPYLDQAFVNVKNIVGFLQNSFAVAGPKGLNTHERTKRKKGGKKVSKQKALRHGR